MSSYCSAVNLECFGEPVQKGHDEGDKKFQQKANNSENKKVLDCSKILDQYVQHQQVTNAEILWALKVVMN